MEKIKRSKGKANYNGFKVFLRTFVFALLCILMLVAGFFVAASVSNLF